MHNEGIANVHLQFMNGLPAPRYIMSIIMSSYQNCNEQQFQTLSCALYTNLSEIKLDLGIQALLLDYIIALEKQLRVCLACILFLYRNQYFEHF